MSTYIRQFRDYLRKNSTAKGLFLVGIVILGAVAVWGGIRLALNTEYPMLVVSSGSMCQRLNPALHTNACTLAIGDLIVIRGVDPTTISNGTIIIFRPYTSNPDYLVVHRVIKVINSTQSSLGQVTFWTEGDSNGVPDGWDVANAGIPGSQVVGVYQFTIPIPYLGSTILTVRDFMYNSDTGQPRTQGILVIVALIVALFAFEVVEPGKKPPSSTISDEVTKPAPKTSVSRVRD